MGVHSQGRKLEKICFFSAEARPLYEGDNMGEYFQTINAFTGERISVDGSEKLGGFGRRADEPVFQHLEDFLPSVIFKDPADGFLNFDFLTELYLCCQRMTRIPDCVLGKQKFWFWGTLTIPGHPIF